MSTFKKLLALTLALAMVLSVSAFAGYKADTYKDAAAIDADCKSAIELMYALDIMKGDTNGNFNPKATITRAEVAKMIYVILNYGKDDLAVNYKGAKIFSDVVAGAWYEGYVNYAATTKLVQGRGNGTFGPNDPVTCAEAAKMLLTAIGYSAEARGYTGANWAQNVLADAAVLGLLEGYDYNTNAYAPRQWVAVMFANALDCYTFNTMVPSFNGLLVSGSGDFESYQTMGKKYYKLDSFTSVAVATPNASIDVATWKEDKVTKTKEFADDYVLFANGKEIKGTGLGAMDLGQKYKVIYKAGSTDVAYSVRALTDTAEARIMDIDVDIVFGTSSNKAHNKYEFTVDGVAAKFAANKINVLKTGTENYTEEVDGELVRTGAVEMTVTQFYDLVDAGAHNNDLYKVVLNGDGEIAYIIVTEYAYGYVNKDGSHNRYGDYIVVDKNADPDVNALLKFNGQTNLYLDDCIICEDEIVKDNIVKYTWNLDEGMYNMEVLPTVEDVTYEAWDKKEACYTLGGEDYYVTTKALTDVETWLKNKSNLDEAICLVVDGDMIVYHWFSDSDYTDMADINAQLAVVIDVDKTYSTGTLKEKQVIEYMTIDGEKHIAEYQDKTTKTDEKDPDYLWFEDIERLTAATTKDELKGRLFILHEGTKGRVYLEKLDNAIVNTQLDASTSLLNLYEEKFADKAATLDATGSAVTFDKDKMAAENVFFYAYIDDNGTAKTSDDEAVYGIITPAEFGDGKDDTAYGQVLSYEKRPSGKTTVLGGYIVAELESDVTNNYLYITKIGKVYSDGMELTVQLVGGEEKTIFAPVDDYYTDLLYTYAYKTMDNEWTLELVDAYDKDVDGKNYDAGFWAERVVKWYDEEYTEIYLKAKVDANDKTLDVSDDDVVDNIVVTTIEFVRDETQSGRDDFDWLNDKDELDSYSRELKVVPYEDLLAEDIENGADTDSYEQSAYWYYNAKADLLYVVVIRDMTQAQSAQAQS